MCICALLTFMSVPHLCAWYFWKSEEGIGFPGSGHKDRCELPCGFWERNPRPME